MDADRFDLLARVFGDAANRRTLVGLLGGATLGGLLTSQTVEEAAAKKKKKKKKKCQPCQKAKKGKCKGIQPDGTPCDGGACLGGACVAATCTPACVAPAVCQNGSCVTPTCTPACVAPQVCQNGSCVAPPCNPACGSGEECVNGACVCPPTKVCGDRCCESLECSAGYCICNEEDFCSCASGSSVCQTNFSDICCRNADTCSPTIGCVTSTCGADNHFCTHERASCSPDGDCACFQKKEDDSPVCGDFPSEFECPPGTGCATDASCPLEDEVCVKVGCVCPEQPTAGLCVLPCPI